jgi:hypothetical protein
VAAAASPAAAASGWLPAPTPPLNYPAGAVCDFPVHGEPVVEEVLTKVLQTYPDGSIHRDAFKGDLVVRMTNTTTGETYDADASGSAIVDHAPDGSQTWYAVGPVLAGFRAGLGNRPRGLYVIDGVYRLAIAASGYKTLTIVHGHADNVCRHFSRARSTRPAARSNPTPAQDTKQVSGTRRR